MPNQAFVRFDISMNITINNTIQKVTQFGIRSSRGEPEVSSTEGATTDQPQPTPSTAVVSGKRQREDPEATER